MAISTTTIIDKVEVLQYGQIQVRQAEIIFKDNQEIARSFTRWVRNPGDTGSQSDPAPVPAIATAVWTPTVISAYEAMIASDAKS